MRTRVAADVPDLSIKFRAVVESAGIDIPAAALVALGHGWRSPLSVTINGIEQCARIGVVGERLMLPTHTSAAVGEQVNVELLVESTRPSRAPVDIIKQREPRSTSVRI